MTLRATIALTALGLVLAACGESDGRGDDGGSGIGLPGGTGGSGGSEGGDESGDDELKLDVPQHDLPGGEEECAAVSEEAELIPLPADIIFVVDNSGSMSFEAGEIQAKMNAFSSQIIASGIDVHVVLVSSYPDDGNGICIDAPLGSGGCPGADDNPPTFTHVDERVSSHNAWETLLATHDQWAPAMREESSKHVVVVTDDTSNMELLPFHEGFQALDPSYADYVHHSVVCHSDCQSAAGIGQRYIDLSIMTGGVAADLCDQDFQAVFDVLSTEVIGGTELACEFSIPAPPDDMEFDPDQVNLEFHDGMGGVLEIGRVDSASDCPNVTDGWYYDDPVTPELILVCPQTCEQLQGSMNGSISIAFGCASVPAG